ncbi:alcohol dehydrogenase catalytic domain-containing protein, partial [Bacillus sp. D-CC]
MSIKLFSSSIGKYSCKPIATGRDILVKINAISVNPVDTKVRSPKEKKEDVAKILGWDASGVVVQTGENCTLFKE